MKAGIAVLVGFGLGIGFLIGNRLGHKEAIAAFRQQIVWLQFQRDANKSASESNARWYESEKERNQALEKELAKAKRERDLAIRNLTAIFEELSRPPSHSTQPVRPRIHHSRAFSFLFVFFFHETPDGLRPNVYQLHEYRFEWW